jgi:hypothetical protein
MSSITCVKETSAFGHYYRLLVTATAAVGFDINVFLYLAMPLRDGQTDQIAAFQGVCSPQDMIDWPVGAPYADAEPPWCRHNSIDLVFPSLASMDAAWTLLQEHLNNLCQVMESLQMLTASAVIHFSANDSIPGE